MANSTNFNIALTKWTRFAKQHFGRFFLSHVPNLSSKSQNFKQNNHCSTATQQHGFIASNLKLAPWNPDLGSIGRVVDE
jgi:hypothetical protein